MFTDQNRPTTSLYTCITCRVAFRDVEIQRQHYKSDWHRYNLKRKVAELPPVAVEEFQKRVIALRGLEDRSRGEGTPSCAACGKTFNTKNQLSNHLSSKKHKERILRRVNDDARRKEPEEREPENEDAPTRQEEDLSRAWETTLNSTNSGVDTAKKRKTAAEDMEAESDVETVDSDEWNDNPMENNDCLFCDKHSGSFLRNLKHMTQAHSFFIPDPEYCVDPKGLLVYLGEKIFNGYLCIWCNERGKAFHSSEAARSHMMDKGHCKMRHEGESLVEYTEYYDYSTSYPDADEADPEAEIDVPEIEDNDYELVLPSGNVIGHRSLVRYYKQSLDPKRPLAISKCDKLRKVLTQYRALGWTGADKTAIEKKARDINYMRRLQAKYTTKLQFKANKLQHHFRQQVNY